MVKKIKPEISIVLDLFRGVSAQLVVIGHLLSFFTWQQKYHIPTIQNFAVLVFFVLSGFLIVQTSFLKGEEYGLKNYLIDRFSRIFFTFIPALVLIFVVDILIQQYGEYSPKYKFDVQNFVANIFQLQSYPFIRKLNIEAFGSGRPLWTVAIEWWLYVGFGFSYYILYLKQKLNFGQLFLFLICLPVLLFYIQNRGQGLTIYWVLGLLLAVAYNHEYKQFNPKLFTMLILLLVAGIAYRTVFCHKMYDLGIALFFTLIIFLFFNAPNSYKIAINSTKMAGLSKILASYSYSLYLVHYSLIELLLVFFKNKSLINFISIVLIVNIVSYLFYLFFEKKYYSLRNIIKNKLS
jgi:peptidoglycan/LPS O-acetylase OafA/YrhL